MTDDLVSILVVDDDADTCLAIAKLLDRPRHFVQTARSRKEAADYAHRVRFHLLIADAILPDGDGLTLLKDFRNLYPIQGIAISVTADLAERARAGGFAAFLEKPISFAKLTEELERLLPHTQF